MVTVRPATIADVPALCGLLAHLFAQEAEFSPDAATQSRGLRQIIEAPDSGTILLLSDGAEAIGMVNLLYLTSTALGGRVALLEDLVIAPGHRAAGHGTRLLQAAIDHARNQACLRITLLTDGDNVIAQCFYGQHGFERSAMVPMRLMLT